MNFDGTVKGNLSISRVGCIIHGEDGTILCDATKILQIGTNNKVEAQAFVLGLQVCKANKFYPCKYLMTNMNAIRKKQTFS